MSSADDRYIGQFRPEYSRVHRDRDFMWVVPFRVPLILAVVGPRFSGVTTALNYMAERHSFEAYTLGAEIRREALKRGISLRARRNLQLLGDEMRSESEDPAVLMRRVMRRVRRDRIDFPGVPPVPSVAIGGLKHVQELTQLRQIDSVHVAVIDCGEADSVRYERIASSGLLKTEYEAERKRRVGLPDELPEWSELAEDDKRSFFSELNSIHLDGHPGSTPGQLRAVPAAVVAEARSLSADPRSRVHVLDNCDGDVSAFRRSIDGLLAEIRPREQVLRHFSELEGEAADE